MDDILKLKNDLKRYANQHKEFLDTIELLNEHKIRLSQKIDLMKKKGFDISKVSNEKDMYATYIETYGTLRDVITECAKSLIFIDEFIDRIKGEENILEEIVACQRMIHKNLNQNLHLLYQ